MFEVGDHNLVLQPARFEVVHQCNVHQCEVAQHVRFDEEVLIGRLNRLIDASDVGDRRCRCDRYRVGVYYGLQYQPAPVPRLNDAFP
jgi:hypothetical protein